MLAGDALLVRAGKAVRACNCLVSLIMRFRVKYSVFSRLNIRCDRTRSSVTRRAGSVTCAEWHHRECPVQQISVRLAPSVDSGLGRLEVTVRRPVHRQSAAQTSKGMYVV